MVDININLNGADGPKKKNNNDVPSYLEGDNSAKQSGSIFGDYQYKTKETKFDYSKKKTLVTSLCNKSMKVTKCLKKQTYL